MLNIPLYRDARGVTITKMRLEHLHRIELKEPELSYERDMPHLRRYLYENADLNASWTAMKTGKPLLCFGIRPAWKNVGEAWLLPGKDIGDYAISVVRYSRKFFTELLRNGEYARIHITVRADNDTALKFAKVLGFEVEGIMRNFGPDGVSCYMMARISEHGISHGTQAASTGPDRGRSTTTR